MAEPFTRSFYGLNFIDDYLGRYRRVLVYDRDLHPNACTDENRNNCNCGNRPLCGIIKPDWNRRYTDRPNPTLKPAGGIYAVQRI
jgi:hypothetical protein